MYGLVNKAIEDLVVSQFDEATWQKVTAAAGLEGTSFVGMDPYEDEVSFKLVGAASEVLGAPVNALLEQFGEFWTTYTAKEGYGQLLDMCGGSFVEFLENLDDLHGRVALSMPDLQPPQFECERLEDGEVRLHYVSERAGLAPMVVGLIRGLAKRFQIEVEIEHVEKATEGAEHDVFHIRELKNA